MSHQLEAWSALCEAAFATSEHGEIASAARAISNAPHAELFFLAANHGLLPRLADVVDLAAGSADLPPRVERQLFDILHANRHSVEVHTDQALALSSALEGAGVDVVFTKGIILQALLYGARGGRRLSDIDLMTDLASASEVASVLTQQGFVVESTFDRRTMQIVPMDRGRLAVYRLFKDHLPHAVMATGAAFPSHVNIDVALSLTWARSEWQVPMKSVLADVEHVNVGRGGSRSLPTLRAHVHFVFLLMHLFREAYFHSPGHDVRLAQFADVALFWKQHRRVVTADAAQFIRAHGLTLPCATMLGYVDDIFGTRIVEAVGLELPPGAERHSVQIGGDIVPWDGNIVGRLLGGGPVTAP